MMTLKLNKNLHTNHIKSVQTSSNFHMPKLKNSVGQSMTS